MIRAEYCRAMARYNAWQNKGLREAMATLPEAELTADRGAFFGSILGTANHLLWGDRMWMSRFAGWAKPTKPGPKSATYYPDAAAWQAARDAADAGIIVWAEAPSDGDLQGDLSWFSGAAGTDMTMATAVCVVGFFNHQTHHRGQIHKMLTEIGYRPGDTDFFLMP
ncbi:MAG: DinB family protein [Pseudomonadota bacterium]